MPSIIIPSTRILFYADYSATHLLPVPGGARNLRKSPTEFGLSILKDILEASLIPSITVDLVNRFWELDSSGDIPVGTIRKKQPTRLTPELLKEYGQIWFFGQHLWTFSDPGTVTADPLTGARISPDQNGYPESILSNAEQSALTDWMNNGGGLLILGDHSNHASSDTRSDPTLLYNLGGALGRDVLRAGQMRVWFGPLSGCGYAVDGPVVNTSGDTSDMLWMPKQADSVPQDIRPRFWDVVTPWSIERHWHPLLQGTPSDADSLGIVRIMPDHGHEGALQMPSKFDPAQWPLASNGYQTKPTVVARGINKDTGTQIDLISAYDGQQVGVGRIVAHTTWHHFVNVNLNGFRHPDGSPDENLQILSQYFLNLASYLMPLPERAGALGMMLQSAASSSTMRDLVGAPLDLIGRAAYGHLEKLATRGQIQDLINLAVEQVIPPKQDDGSLQLRLPSLDYLLGDLVAAHRSSYGSGQYDDLRHSYAQMACAARGIKRALSTRSAEYAAEAEALRRLVGSSLG